MSVASKPSPMTLMSNPQPSGAFAWTQEPAGRVLRCRPLLDIADHFFTTRDLRLRDDEEEWVRVARTIVVAPDALRLVHQVHGRGVLVARGRAPAGRHWPDADAVVRVEPPEVVVGHVDLWRANRDQLEAAGVPSDAIHVAALCTKTHARVLHSYRADRERAGRMAGVIRVKGRR